MTRPLYDDLERRMQGNYPLLTILSTFVFPWLTFTFLLHCSFFVSKLNGMATEIGSLVAGLDGHGLRLGIGRKGLRKTWGNPRNTLSRRTHFFIVDFKVVALPKTLFLSSLPLDTRTDTFGTAGQLSPSSFRSSLH
jgi:hypothetical protein